MEKVNTTIAFCIFELLWIPNFTLHHIPLKPIFRSKTKKVKITIELYIFELVWAPNFTLTNNFEFWDQICPKRAFSAENNESEHHDWILHIGRVFLIENEKKWISPLHCAHLNYSEYQVSLCRNNFKFWNQIYPKRVFSAENRKHEHHDWKVLWMACCA